MTRPVSFIVCDFGGTKVTIKIVLNQILQAVIWSYVENSSALAYSARFKEFIEMITAQETEFTIKRTAN